MSNKCVRCGLELNNCDCDVLAAAAAVAGAPSFAHEFTKHGFIWSDSNVAKARFGWDLAMSALATPAAAADKKEPI